MNAGAKTGRIAAAFERARNEGRTPLIVYLTASDPDFDTSLALVSAAAAAGADVIELGVPWSDPSADGLAIQAAMGRALQAGGGLAQTLELTRRIRAANPDLPVVLFGHSLGGLISASYVVDGRPSPDLLVLSSPALGAVTPRWQRRLAPLLARVVPRLVVPSVVDYEVLSRDPEVQAAYRDDPLRLTGMTAGFGHEVFKAMVATSAALERITMPTYVLHGSDDDLVPAELSRPMDAYPNVTYRLWPGLRHETMNEPEGEEVLAAVAAWLDKALVNLDGRLADDR